VVLAGLSIDGGVIQLPGWFWVPKGLQYKLEDWLEAVVPGEANLSASAKDLSGILAFVAIAIALAGIAAAIAVYAKHRAKPIEPQILADAWGYDRLVSNFMGGPGRKAFEGVAWADANVVDGAVNGTGELVRAVAGKARLLQSGNVRTYAAAVGAGVVLLLVWFVVVRGIL